MFIFPLSAAIISFVFSFLVFRQYFQRHKPYQFAWAVALLMFGIASLAETISVISSWNELLVKIWYFFGAMIVVGYLGLGSLYIAEKKVASRLLEIGIVLALLGPVLPMVIFSKTASGPEKLTTALVFGGIFTLIFILTVVTKRPATIWLWTMIGASLGGALMLVNSSINNQKVASLGWEAMTRSLMMKATVASLNTIGTVILAGGALYSAWVLYRKQILREIAIGNILIGIGALINAFGGVIHGYFKLAGPAVLSVSLTIGITVMFLGFLETGHRANKPAKK